MKMTMIERVDAAMVEMRGIFPPLRRSDCERLIRAALVDLYPETPPIYDRTYCSNCGGKFGPGDHGFSHCENHAGQRRLY